ncbi:MAG TPA: FHA domain-containing protein [Polyangiaceae bacterium]|jgi:pSer/pThr/pTyr-binding forkhead associated (FHA) protein|nr:FHA domain-containing protein [Polyangiaceae bacterium]
MIVAAVVTEYRLQYRGTLFPIRSGEVILGRSSYASIVVNNPLASREHAVVRSAGGGLEVQDLGSKNGTYVNGNRVEGKCSVDEGDLIKIGTDVLEVAKISVLDPQQLRVATEPGRSPTQQLDGDTTVNLGRSLELAETIASAAPVERHAVVAVEVLDIVTELLADIRLDATERRRGRGVMDILATWKLSPELEQRRKDLVSKLSESGPTSR